MKIATSYIGLAFFILGCFVSLRTNAQLGLQYDEFGVFFKPLKCIDTLEFTLTKSYPGSKLKLYLKDCMGKCDFELYDRKGRLKIKGSYVDGKDTLIKYKSTVTRGLPNTGNKRYYRIRLLKYLSPFEKGIWTYYDDRGNISEKVDIDFNYEKL